MSEKVNLTIDGKKIAADNKKTVFQAALENGIYIPTLCYLEKLNPIGSCRICLVEVEGADEPMTSCQLPVMEGMIVTTKSDKLTELRQMMVKLMLVNHPVDCTVCERSGECQLQNKTYELGVKRQDLRAEPVKREKRYDWRLIRYDPNLCVLCERCIRVCHEVQGVSAYKISQRGFKSVIDTVDEKPLDCDFCGQCIAVCPVGALNSGLVLQARSWELTKTRTVCPYCGTGCSLYLDVKPVPERLYQGKGKIYRVSSDDNIGINNGNLCARGKFGYQFIESEERIKTPLIRKGDTLMPASWDEALKLIGDKFKEIKNNYGGEAIAGIGSERAANEDNYLFQKFFRNVLGSNNITAIGYQLSAISHQPSDFSFIKEADLIFTIGADLSEENPVIGNMIRMAMRDNETCLITGSSRNIGFKPPPDYRIIYKYGAEISLITGIVKAIAGSGTLSSGLGGKWEDVKGFISSLNEIKIEDVSSKSGVPSDLIETAAFKLSKSKSPVILIGREIYSHPSGVEIVHALQNLSHLIKGKMMLYREYCNSQGVNDMGVASDSDIFDMAMDGKIKALYVMGEDPVVRFRHYSLVRDALKKVAFIVVQDMFLTETALSADVILPCASFSEREGTFTNMEGRVQKLNKAIEPIGESKTDWEIINELGKIMGAGFQYSTAEDIFKEITAAVPAYSDMTYSNIKKDGQLAKYQVTSGKEFKAVRQKDMEIEGENMPFTPLEKAPSARAELGKREKLFGRGLKPLPNFLTGFTLITGNSFFHLGTLSRKSQAMNMLTTECRVEINCTDAVDLKINDGERVKVESVNGSIIIKCKVTNKSPQGIVFIPVNFENAPVNILTSKMDAVTKVKISKVD
ncbi:MAG: molybdopterin-dependent oxidoreductase [Nitrospinae bacterium]|nr:molybdopterin-dependent oxidoreductase [Nitrospinota bacterium]